MSANQAKRAAFSSVAWTDPVIECLRTERLPDNGEELFTSLMSDDETHFVAQENTFFDYKAEFPFGSESFAVEFARHVAAFHNSYGGLLLFGVHDTKRTAGHNPVKINIERDNTRLAKALSHPVHCQFKSYATPAGNVDVFLVPRRRAGIPPIRPVTGGPKVERIWLRRGHETRAATSKDIPFLYGSRDGFGVDVALDSGNRVQGSLPPSPATVRDFVGRLDALDRLFTWLREPDEPRFFLYGKGGSGKSTIAYEFARIVVESGKAISLGGAAPIERVIWLSAKATQFNPLARVAETFQGTDFTDATDLFRKILLLSDWSSEGHIQKLEYEGLLRDLKELLNLESQVIIVDDIDTVLLNQRDAGLEDLFGILARARTQSRVLYTQRNQPLHSLRNSFEVPGLRASDEYPEFVQNCARQFDVEVPPDQIRDGEIAQASERRPLLVETIVGLRKYAPSYAKVLEMWRDRSGDRAREYLFHREYDALPSDHRARHMLAALSLIPRPVRLRELQDILNCSDEQILECVQATQEIFLSRSKANDGETVFQLGEATRSFLRQVSQSLDRFKSIDVRVRQYISGGPRQLPGVSEIETRCTKHLREGRPDLAWKAILDSKIKEEIRENAAFLALRGAIAAKQDPPLLRDTRDSFASAFRMKYRNPAMMKDWVDVERAHGYGVTEGCKVCDLVVASDFEEEVKAEFLQRKASILYHAALADLEVATTDSIERLIDALHTHLAAYEMIFQTKRPNIERFEEYLRNSCFKLFQVLLKVGDDVRAVRTVNDLRKRSGPLDPLAQPIVELVRSVASRQRRYSTMYGTNALSEQLRMLRDHLANPKMFVFHDVELRREVINTVRQVAA